MPLFCGRTEKEVVVENFFAYGFFQSARIIHISGCERNDKLFLNIFKTFLLMLKTSFIQTQSTLHTQFACQ